MQLPIPYMVTVKNLDKIFAAIQKAACPETFTIDFVNDLGFTSSNDRGVTKILKYMGFLDPSGKPTSHYREFMDKNKGGMVLARRLTVAFDDLFNADREAHSKTSESLKGCSKTKTGQGDAVAKKIATTFKKLADLAEFKDVDATIPKIEGEAEEEPDKGIPAETAVKSKAPPLIELPKPSYSSTIGLVYRVEIHLPDTQNVDTFRAIFKALREELM